MINENKKNGTNCKSLNHLLPGVFCSVMLKKRVSVSLQTQKKTYRKQKNK